MLFLKPPPPHRLIGTKLVYKQIKAYESIRQLPCKFQPSCQKAYSFFANGKPYYACFHLILLPLTLTDLVANFHSMSSRNAIDYFLLLQLNFKIVSALKCSIGFLI